VSSGVHEQGPAPSSLEYGNQTNSIIPYFGIGSGHFDAVMDQCCAINQCANDLSGFHGVHNQFLDSGMNVGMVGFWGLMLSCLGLVFLFARRISSPLSSCCSW